MLIKELNSRDDNYADVEEPVPLTYKNHRTNVEAGGKSSSGDDRKVNQRGMCRR